MNFHLNLQPLVSGELQIAPDLVFIATYSDGFNLIRKEILAPYRLAAYAKAVTRTLEQINAQELALFNRAEAQAINARAA